MSPEVTKVKRLAVEDQLKDLGISRVKYYYHKTPLVNNVFTACLLIKNKEIVARGISICSMLDVFSKVHGRGKSLSMALKAANSLETSEEIVYEPDRWDSKFVIRNFRIKDKVDSRIFEETLKPFIYGEIKTIRSKNKNGPAKVKILYHIPRDYTLVETLKIFSYKSIFQPELTIFEQRLM